MAVNDYKNLVEESLAQSSRCAFLRQHGRRRRELSIVSAHVPAETTEDKKEREGCAELCSKDSTLGEDAGNRGRRRHQPAD
ncbi:hypothetical protein RB195_008377 [Necator americanus]|uniref:Uncharacterized protein n=1 Tax=Necator americanus TaxID=51031 RepID=A0ABR1CPM1_NECAM